MLFCLGDLEPAYNVKSRHRAVKQPDRPTASNPLRPTGGCCAEREGTVSLFPFLVWPSVARVIHRSALPWLLSH